MARGEVAKDCRVGEGSTSSGRNSGSSAKRSSKSTSDRTLLEGWQSHFPCPSLHCPISHQPHTLRHKSQPVLTCPQSQRSSSGAGAAPSPSFRYQLPPCARGCPRLLCCYCPHCHHHCQGLGLGLGWGGWEAPPGSLGPAQELASLKMSWGIC